MDFMTLEHAKIGKKVQIADPISGGGWLFAHGSLLGVIMRWICTWFFKWVLPWWCGSAAHMAFSLSSAAANSTPHPACRRKQSAHTHTHTHTQQKPCHRRPLVATQWQPLLPILLSATQQPEEWVTRAAAVCLVVPDTPAALDWQMVRGICVRVHVCVVCSACRLFKAGMFRWRHQSQ
eukprot:782726-Pelagomonas_calceolata.AAC.1